jgi:hypothetical protein
VTTRYRQPQLLADEHDIDRFVCRSVEQTTWLREHARQSNAMGVTRVLVVTPLDATEVVAYYAWCMASIESDSVPARARRGAGRYPQPVALLARLGVSAELSREIGCRGLLVHAESEVARNFYLHLIPEFEESPTDPLHLVLLMKDIRRTLSDG